MPDESAGAEGIGHALIIALDVEPLPEFYKDLLEDKGYRVAAVTHGSEMLATIRSKKTALILAGLNAIQEYVPAYRWALQNIMVEGGIPMLFITAAGYNRVKREIPQSRIVRVLQKPAPAAVIFEAIQVLLLGK